MSNQNGIVDGVSSGTEVRETPRGWSSTQAKDRATLPTVYVDMAKVAQGDSLLLEDGQLVEVQSCTREYEYRGGLNTGLYGSHYGGGGSLTGKYWRVVFVKPLRSGATVADFKDDGMTHFEGNKRVPHVKCVVRGARP